MELWDRSSGNGLLVGFDEYLRRTRGVCPGHEAELHEVRPARSWCAVFADGPVDVAGIAPATGDRVRRGADAPLTGRGRWSRRRRRCGLLPVPARGRGWGGPLGGRGADGAAPTSGLVRHLDPRRFEQLIASLDSASPRGLRDRAIIVCMARLGLRAGEVVQLRLDDLDWRQRDRAGARPQDRPWRVVAADRRRWCRAGRLPAAGAPRRSRPRGFRAAPATGRCTDQQQHRGTRRG